ncbi:MAG: IS3 family transposase ISLmo5 [Eubacteriales bacterium SKADARSKE-1]|nr:IS3 family transposase ISLmo5 [Eubacteriales bacterium SKADARSKE-1]
MSHSVSVLCNVLKVNRSTYYKFINKVPSSREQENVRIRTAILEIYAKLDKRLGAAKIAICLKRDYCISISSGRVYRLMQSMKLPKMSTVKPFIKNDSSCQENCNNVLSQNFDQPAPNLVWVCDFTYLKAASKFYYLCVILDLFSRKVKAFCLSTKIDRFLALGTLKDATDSRSISPGLIFHSDRGSQFTCDDFRKELDRLNILQSFSNKGHPYDNAVMECFFKYLKKEETSRRNYQSFEQLSLSIFQYFHGFYNSYRPHFYNDGLSPNEKENNFF